MQMKSSICLTLQTNTNKDIIVFIIKTFRGTEFSVEDRDGGSSRAAVSSCRPHTRGFTQ